MQPKERIRDIEELVNACANNNRKAQLKVYQLYSRSMFNTSLRIVQNRPVAEDVVQESFIKAFSSLDGFRHEVPFVIWLRKIVINKSLDELRKRKEYLLEDGDEYPEPIENTDYEIEAEPIRREQDVMRIKKALNELSEGYRVIFSLFYFEGYDHDEISAILKITPSTSRSQLARAKSKLLEKLNLNIKIL